MNEISEDIDLKEVKLEKKVFNIFPCKKRTRALVFLSDIFMCFILSVFLFEIVVMQIAKPIINYSGMQQQTLQYEVDRRNILVDNGLLFIGDDKNFNFSKDLSKTCDEFLRFYTFDDTSTKGDVFYKYFVELKGKDVSIVNNYYKENGERYFDVEGTKTSLGTYKLNETFVTLFKPSYVEGDEISETGKKELESFQNKFFLNVYKYVIYDIKENDIKSINFEYSYNEYSKFIETRSDTLTNTYIIAAYISFIISSIILFFVIPLCNHKGRTISEMILKIEHIYKNDYSYLKKRFVVVEGFFNTLNSFVILAFIPCISVPFAELFAFPYLVSVSVVSLLFIILELVLLLSTDLNQTLKEKGTNSIVVDTSLMDTYYRDIGYDI